MYLQLFFGYTSTSHFPFPLYTKSIRMEVFIFTLSGLPLWGKKGKGKKKIVGEKKLLSKYSILRSSYFNKKYSILL